MLWLRGLSTVMYVVAIEIGGCCVAAPSVGMLPMLLSPPHLEQFWVPYPDGSM